MPPETRYARSGEASIAYQVLGDGPFDLVFVPGFVSNVEYGWELPELARFYERLASFCRLIIFDKRGTGLSDRVGGVPQLETRMDDVRAVLDAAGSERAAVIGVSEGGPMTLMFAATYPERTAAIVVFGPSPPKAVRTPEFPWASTREEWDAWIAEEERKWGTRAWSQQLLESFAPSRASDAAFLRWWDTWLRMSVSPGAKVALSRMNSEIDVRHVLPAISSPTLVLHRRDDEACPIESSRYLAEQIRGAWYVELPGRDHLVWVDGDGVAEQVEEFLTGIWDAGEWEVEEPGRILATVLFTDIVGSTEKAIELGDRRWRDVLEGHNAAVRRQLARFRGEEVDTAGDGFFATFDGPARAIRCACAIAGAVEELGVGVRAGLHTGECELVEGKVGGVAVHIGARVAAQATAGQVLVSSTVKDLVAGSGIRFADQGERELKGIPGAWRLYAVEAA